MVLKLHQTATGVPDTSTFGHCLGAGGATGSKEGSWVLTSACSGTLLFLCCLSHQLTLNEQEPHRDVNACSSSPSVRAPLPWGGEGRGG